MLNREQILKEITEWYYFAPERLVYLATPYSLIDRDFAAKEAARLAKELQEALFEIKVPVSVFSPIVLGHNMAPKWTWDQWQIFNLSFLQASLGLVMVQMEGSGKSVGMKWEEDWAKGRRPVAWWDPGRDGAS